VTSVVNRYYDPTIDQFLSIDPDVAETVQPYVFTNDDPLNAEDPLGDGAVGIAQRVICGLMLTANCLGILGGDVSTSLRESAEQAAAVVSGDTEDMERTAGKAAGEVGEVVETAGKGIENTAKAVGTEAEKIRVLVGVRTSRIISDLTPSSSSPSIKIGPVKIPIFDFDFGL
jgi:hypothetical protein